MEAESGSHPSQTIDILLHKMCLYCRYSAVSGTTTGTLLSLTVTVHALHLHRTLTAEMTTETFVVIKSAATMNAFIIVKQQLHPLNCPN